MSTTQIRSVTWAGVTVLFSGLVLAQGQFSNFVPSNNIAHLFVAGDTLWVGTSRGLGRSTDRGLSWENFRKIPEFASDGIFAVAVEGKTVWASTGIDKRIDNNDIQTGTGLTYSLDAGLTWRHLPQPVDPPSDSIIQYGINRMRILPVTVPEQNVTFDISLRRGSVWIASWASGLRKSTDNGQTWNRIVLPSDNLNKISPTDSLTYAIDPRLHLNLTPFSVLSVSDSEIWVGTAGGVNKSTDGGVSWVKYNQQNQDSAILGNWVIRIKEQRIRGRTRIWTSNWQAAERSERFGVSFTENGGKTWHNLLHDVKAYDFAFRDSLVYIATDEGVYRTSDDGRTWNKAMTIIDPDNRQRFSKATVFAVGVQGNAVWVTGPEGLATTVDDGSQLFGERWRVYRTFQPVGVTRKTYAFPNPFAPDDQVVRFHYSTEGRDASVKLQIFDFGMNLVRTLLRGALRPGNIEHDEIWDGRDDEGRLVANGVYFYKVELDQDPPIWGKVIVLQ